MKRRREADRRLPSAVRWPPLLLFLLLLVGGAQGLRTVIVEGDIMLGGLFPIHEAGRNATQCGGIKADQGLQRMIAMVYALKLVNDDPLILPGIRLGAQILDTCSVETHALEQSLDFIKSIYSKDLMCADGSRASYQKQPIVAVIGAASSQVSVMVSSMLQLFRIPMLSYSSTGVELSEKPRFDYFSRVVPPDNLQAKAIANVIHNLEWKFVHGVVDSGSYGERGMDSFRAAATERGICIDGDIHKISRRWTDEQFEHVDGRELLLRMRQSNKARGVIMFVDEDNLRRLLMTLKRMVDSGAHPEMRNYFWFVASDSWGMKTAVIKGFEDIVRGAITVAPQMRHVEGFDDYFGSLGPENTFLSEYWRALNCSSRINENFQRCFENVNYKFRQEAYVPSVVDSVRIMAKALHTYIDTYCRSLPWKHCHLSRIGFEGYRLQKFYRNQSLEPNGPALIDEHGDGIGQYSIFQLGPGGIYSEVGRWNAGSKMTLAVDEIRRGLQAIDNSTALPVSVCSSPCQRGFYRAYQDLQCCWTCIPCDITTSIIVNETSCVQCPLGQVPNVRYDACRSIRPVYLEYTSPWALIPAAFSLCGLIATTFVVSVFVRYSNTPVVMASGRELSYCMLSGIGLCFMCTFVLVSRPSVVICSMSRLMIGLALCAIYAAIFVKTNRLARVFKPTTPLRPRCISPPAQVALCAGIVITQLIGSLVWLVVDPPDTAIQYPTRTEAVLTCKATASHLLLSLSFNMLLVLLCTFYAFKTRQIPENFNETRLIGFTMYSTSILWLSFGPIYFATQNSFHIQITSLCICISMSATVALSCFFFPKVYICLYAPYKNVRNRNSAVGKLVNQQMRFISQMTTPNEIPSHPPTRMGLELSTNCTTSASAMDGSTTHAASSSETSYNEAQHGVPRPTPVPLDSTKPHSPPRAATVQLSSKTTTSTIVRRSIQVSPPSAPAAHRRASLPARAAAFANAEGLRAPLMNSEFIKRLCNGGFNLKTRLTFQKGSIEEESENIDDDDNEDELVTDEVETDDDDEKAEDPRARLLRRIDSDQQSPPPIQLLLHEISNDSFATFL